MKTWRALGYAYCLLTVFLATPGLWTIHVNVGFAFLLVFLALIALLVSEIQAPTPNPKPDKRPTETEFDDERYR